MFIPKRIIFEKDSLDYPIGVSVLDRFSSRDDIEIINLSSNRVKGSIPGDNLHDMYREGKRTLVLGIKKGLKFQSCKPSAHYMLPLVSGCMGQCQYCYLNTQLGDKPFVKVHVNIDDILDKADQYTKERLPETTIFEGAATSDPIPVEPYTGSLARAITHFGKCEYSRFRFVTKYTDVDTLLDLPHNGHTEIRFSINTSTVINSYEGLTASWDKRIAASQKVASAGYPVGFLIAPVFIYPGWREEYTELLNRLKSVMPDNLNYPLTFEVISHRYTPIAKERIMEIFPDNTLPMADEDRKYKYGQFGYGKYVYTKEEMGELKEFFKSSLESLFPLAEIKYII
ncbi:MAG: spore photoproduct lyase [Clostridium sp.]